MQKYKTMLRISELIEPLVLLSQFCNDHVYKLETMCEYSDIERLFCFTITDCIKYCISSK